MSSLSGQLKTKILAGSSSKSTFNPQNSQRSTIQGDKSGCGMPQKRISSNSPDDEEQVIMRATLRGQKSNFAFMPAKTQTSPTQSKQQENQSNQTNLFAGRISKNDNNNQLMQQNSKMKISPPRSGTTIGSSKVVIPANQIKLMKKDGSSPSPESRLSNQLPLNFQNSLKDLKSPMKDSQQQNEGKHIQ